MTFAVVCQQVAAWVERELAPVMALATAYEESISPERIGQLGEAEIEDRVASLREVFAETDTLVGLGFAAGHGTMSNRENYLFWLLKTAGGVRRLALNLEPRDPNLYDYHGSEWFSGARELRTPSIYGPYLDYSGADLLIHTAAVPIISGNTFVGVAGGDLLADAVEDRLSQLLHRIDGEAIVITRDRVVVASTSPQCLPGERLWADPAGRPDWTSVAPVDHWTGWTVAARTTS